MQISDNGRSPVPPTGKGAAPLSKNPAGHTAWSFPWTPLPIDRTLSGLLEKRAGPLIQSGSHQPPALCAFLKGFIFLSFAFISVDDIKKKSLCQAKALSFFKLIIYQWQTGVRS